RFLIQPEIDFEYEVSFYFINDKLEYALYAPDKTRRWELRQYNCSAEDLSFAQKFIDWNTIDKGIQSVDACRAKDGRLLLVELEDLNPYLSLLEVDEKTNIIIISRQKTRDYETKIFKFLKYIYIIPTAFFQKKG
ncbi:MAG: hypothetical protein K6F64_09045, partial [Clostridia bacterium]|nr:hypothetical protein [Clostridia bacterium]